MTDKELQTLIKDMDDYQTGYVPEMLLKIGFLMERATKGLKSQQARIEEQAKEIQELLAENEALSLRLFNYEKGDDDI